MNKLERVRVCIVFARVSEREREKESLRMRRRRSGPTTIFMTICVSVGGRETRRFHNGLSVCMKEREREREIERERDRERERERKI